MKHFVLLCAAMMVCHGYAGVPQQIHYQGRLVDGTNLVNGTSEFVFRLFDDAAGGNLLFAETQTVTVVDGLYSVQVGATNNVPGALSAALTNEAVFLEVSVDSTDLAPRERLLSVAYAITAAGVTDGAINANMIAAGAITDEAIATNASISADKLDVAGIDHGSLSGLADDDHTQYLERDGSDGMTGDLQMQGNRVLGSGFIGIGTSDPKDKLDIEGDTASVRISNTAASESGLKMVNAADASNQYAHILYDTSGGADSNALQFYVDSAKPLLTLDDRGLVGVQEEDPEAVFQVSIPSGLDSETYFLVKRAVGSPNFIIDFSGVGLGIEEPEGLFHVDGDARTNPVMMVYGGKSAPFSGPRPGSPIYLKAGAGSDSSTGNAGGGGEVVIAAGDGGTNVSTGVGSPQGGGSLTLSGGDKVGTSSRPGARIVLEGGSFSTGNVLIAVSEDGSQAGSVGIGTGAPEADVHVRRTRGDTVLMIEADGDNDEESDNPAVWLRQDGGLVQGFISMIGTNDQYAADTRGNYLLVGSVANGVQILSDNTVALTIDPNQLLGIGTSDPDTRFHLVHNSTPAIIDRLGSDGNLIRFRKDGIQEGSISVAGSTVSYNNFTGSHPGWTDDPIEPGMLVSMTGRNRNYHDNPDSEVLYGIKLTDRYNDPAVLGVYGGILEPGEEAGSSNPHMVQAAGNSEVWVVDMGADVRPGDYLIASPLPGHAMVDDRSQPESHVIGKAGTAVDWRAVEPDADGIRRAKISVLFGAFARANSSGFR